MNPDIRWKQRFQNFEKAFLLLQEALDGDWRSLSLLEKAGVIQRFEFTFELAWKTLKDYLIFSGVKLDQPTPRNVIKQGFAAQILPDGKAWIDMMGLRNLMSHTYDQVAFTQAVEQIATRYLGVFDQLYKFLKEKSLP